MRRLMAFPWPGNVRQLENVIERAVALSPGRTHIEAAALPRELQEAEPQTDAWRVALPEHGVDLDAVVAATERHLIAQALDRAGGNRSRAAGLLGLKRTTLVEKLKRLQS
jgi:DNA-binding NtrC family response regulator